MREDYEDDEEHELISEDTLRTLTGAVFLGFVLSDIMIIENDQFWTFAIVLPFQLAMVAFHRKRLTLVLKRVAHLITHPYMNMFKTIYKIFTGRTYGKDKWNPVKPAPTKAIDPKVNGKWEVPVKLTPESEAKLNRYMKHYELDYEPEFEDKEKKLKEARAAEDNRRAQQEMDSRVIERPRIRTIEGPIGEPKYVDSQGNPLRPEVLQSLEDFHGITVDNHISHSNFKFNGTTRSTTVTETTQTLKSNNSKIVVDNAKIKGNNNRITGNSNVIKGNNLRVKGNNNIINGNNCYVDGKDNIVTGNNATVINRGGSIISGGNNGKIKDF